MNTKLLLGVLLILVLGAGAVFTLMVKEDGAGDMEDNNALTNNESDEMAESDAGNNNIDDVSSGMGSFAYLMGLGRSLRCDVVYEAQPDSAVAATVYFDDGKMRADSEMMQAGEVYNSHMIMDGDMMYTWNEGGPSQMAVKFKIDQSNSSPDSASSGGGSERPVNLEQDVDYKCESWRADSSKFVPPSNIQFMDLAEMMQSFGAQGSFSQ